MLFWHFVLSGPAAFVMNHKMIDRNISLFQLQFDDIYYDQHPIERVKDSLRNGC